MPTTHESDLGEYPEDLISRLGLTELAGQMSVCTVAMQGYSDKAFDRTITEEESIAHLNASTKYNGLKELLDARFDILNLGDSQRGSIMDFIWTRGIR